MTLTAFVCPHCGDRVPGAHPNADVTHPCPRNKNRTTSYRIAVSPSETVIPADPITPLRSGASAPVRRCPPA
jgi:hypothetical protein